MGISVSFWLNNWTETKKYTKARNEFLISLKQELILDTIQLSKKIADFSSVNENVIKGIALIDKVQHSEIEKNEFQSAIRPIMMLTPINKNKKNDIKISSGIIENIEFNNLYQIEGTKQICKTVNVSNDCYDQERLFRIDESGLVQ